MLGLASVRRLILSARLDAIGGRDEGTFVVSKDGSAAIVQQVATLSVRQPLEAKPEVRNYHSVINSEKVLAEPKNCYEQFYLAYYPNVNR